MSVTSTVAFRNALRYGKYEGKGYMAQKLDSSEFIASPTQGVYLLNKPLTDPADAVAYHQIKLIDGRALVFIGLNWGSALIEQFVERFNKNQIYFTKTRGSYKTIPQWRRNVTIWLNENGLAHNVVGRWTNETIQNVLKTTGMDVKQATINGHTSGHSADGRIGFSHANYRNKKWGWVLFLIRFADEEQMDQYLDRICTTDKCWIYDKNERTILFAATYENRYVSLRDTRLEQIKRMDDHEMMLYHALWTNDEESCHQYYDQYIGYMMRTGSDRYKEWFKDDGTDGGRPENGTFKFLKNLVCVPMDQGPISVNQAVALLMVRQTEDIGNEQTSD